MCILAEQLKPLLHSDLWTASAEGLCHFSNFSNFAIYTDTHRGARSGPLSCFPAVLWNNTYDDRKLKSC